jgi:hypothetical protein
MYTVYGGEVLDLPGYCCLFRKVIMRVTRVVSVQKFYQGFGVIYF